MRSIFGPRGMILIWVVLTASIGFSEQLKQLAVEIHTTHPETLISQLFEGINSIPPNAIDAFFNAVHFEPTAVIFSISVIQIQTIHLVFLIGALTLEMGIVVLLYQKAICSAAFADDFVMLLISYLAFQIVVGIWIRTDASIRPIQPGLLCFLMILTVVILTLRGGVSDTIKIPIYDR